MLLAAATGAAAGAAAAAEAAEPTPKTRGQAPYGWSAGMVLVGSYTCRTPAWLILHVHACNASAVEAVFQFVYPTTTQHGAFWVSGQFGATRALKLAPTTAWLTPAPPRVVPVGLLGIISDEGRRFKGEVLHGGCGGFDVNLTTWDGARFGPPHEKPAAGAAEATLADGGQSRTATATVGAMGSLIAEERTRRAVAGGAASNETLFALLAHDDFAAAYGVGCRLRADAPARALPTALHVVREIRHHKEEQLLLGKGAVEHVLRTLAIFGGLSSISSSLLAVLSSDADADDLALAEEQLRLQLGRSGSVAHDELSAAGLAQLRRAESDPEAARQALGTFQQLVAGAGSWWGTAHRRVGAAHFVLKEYEACADAMRAALRLNPHDVYAKFDLGLCLKESGRNAEAFAAFEEVARDHPTYAKLRGLKQWRDFYRAQSK